MTKIEWAHPAGFNGETWSPVVACVAAVWAFPNVKGGAA
ncbi:hypothetical protein SAMN04515695_2215 [Pseudovibrio sp. Tun.PSC04-5.I4]|nr:hypothetical protein SAMN04515695_2215 [Pseudovibrio sp. Tun.PSC04-5.I4]